MKKKASKANHVTLSLDEDICRRIEELSDALHTVSWSAIVSQAIVRWHASEPLLRGAEPKS